MGFLSLIVSLETLYLAPPTPSPSVAYSRERERGRNVIRQDIETKRESQSHMNRPRLNRGIELNGIRSIY